MILLGSGGIVGGIISGFLVKSIGSRLTLMITFAGCLLACSVLLLTNKVFSPVIYVELAVLSLFFGISQGALSSIIPELFPVTIRASATGVSFNIGRFFTATAVLFTSTLITYMGGLSNALQAFSISFLLALIAVLIRHKPKTF
jgi:MFS family permease